MGFNKIFVKPKLKHAYPIFRKNDFIDYFWSLLVNQDEKCEFQRQIRILHDRLYYIEFSDFYKHLSYLDQVKKLINQKFNFRFWKGTDRYNIDEQDFN